MTSASSATLSLQPEFAPREESRARPVFFDGLAGMYHAAAGAAAVLLVSPWGFEELSSRTTYRLIGERLAALGYPCLRFDLPGTGHSAGASSEIDDDEAWRKATRAAFDHLQSLCNPREIVVIGQGPGALLAGNLAQERTVGGLVLLAPVSQGRAYLREVAAWTAMTKPEFKVSSTDGPEGGLMSAGFVLSAATANELKRLKLLDVPPPQARRTLLAKRPDHLGDAKLAEDLAASGTPMDTIPFADHADYVSSPIFGSFPAETVDKVVTWLTRHFPTSPEAALVDAPAPALLETENYKERLVRFGPNDMFFGALTTPADRKAKTALVILNAGADHSVGWGRYSVDLAREMAGEGFAVLRMDLAGVGETPLWPGQQQPVMYALRANDDVACAIDWLAAEAGIERVVLIGRCSGGYPALLSAVSDRRVVGSFLINVRKLHWEPDEDIYKAIREPVEPLDTYRKNIGSSRQFKRILSGELPISTIVRRLSHTLAAVADRKLAALLGNRSKHYRIGRIVKERLQTLKERDVVVGLIFSHGDPGLIDLYSWAGPDAGKLAAYPNLKLVVIENADHNLSPIPIRTEVTGVLRDFLKGVPTA
jgi:alpha-beta hydrolase superfamily lysophospholipase